MFDNDRMLNAGFKSPDVRNVALRCIHMASSLRLRKSSGNTGRCRLRP